MKLTIEYVDINSIKPYARNARKHEPISISGIKKSIETFGMNDAIGVGIIS